MPLPMEKKELFNLMDEYMAAKGAAFGINQVMEYDLRERMVRVEEAIKNQSGIFIEKFDRIDKQFDKVDKRFETIQASMDKRFETMQESMDKRFIEQHNDILNLGKRVDRFMIWSFGTMVTATGIIIGAMRFFI